MLSVIVPTKNESANIVKCVQAFAWAVDAGLVEVIVVDNNSDDDTCALAAKSGAMVVTRGPERSAQRNYGAMSVAKGEYAFFVDADMFVKKETLQEIMDVLGRDDPPDALFVREEIGGSGYWNRVRNFERSFYDATCIDGLRVIRRDLFTELKGYDEKLYACEDWDLDRRIIDRGAKLSITKGALVHNEGEGSPRRNLEKKAYYAKGVHLYTEKWGRDATVRKQLGPWYRMFGVFMEEGRWRKGIRRPDMMLCVWVYRFLIGITYLLNRRKD